MLGMGEGPDHWKTPEEIEKERSAQTEQKQTSVTYDQLQAEAEKLVALLKDRETGVFSWHTCVHERLENLHNLLCPMFKK